MEKKSGIDFDQALPLFPLPNCVLLPHAAMPLHIFESRYRSMVGDALKDQNVIAMATFDGHEWKQDYAGNPPLRQHVCVAYIVRHEKMAGGQCNILVQGLCRARIIEEISYAPYRIAVLMPTELQPVMEIDLGEQRQRIEKLLSDRLLKQLVSISKIHNWLSNEILTTELVDLAIMTLCGEVEQRYDMLAEPDVLIRTHWLERQLRQIRHTLQCAEQIGPSQSPDGLCLN